jgi:hypothetical protein
MGFVSTTGVHIKIGTAALQKRRTALFDPVFDTRRKLRLQHAKDLSGFAVAISKGRDRRLDTVEQLALDRRCC